jgi:hypothetical protein
MELKSLIFLSWYKHFKSDRDKITHIPVLIHTLFNSITFEMSVSRQECERIYLHHFWNVCINTGKWAILSLSLLKCLYQDRKVNEFISVTFEMFVSWQESEWVNSLTFLSWYRHFKSDGVKLAYFPFLIDISKVTELNSLTFLSWYKHFKSDRDKLAHFPVLIQTFQKWWS